MTVERLRNAGSGLFEHTVPSVNCKGRSTAIMKVERLRIAGSGLFERTVPSGKTVKEGVLL